MPLGLPLLTACAGSFQEPALSPQHPASPQATEAPWNDPSSTLHQGAQDEDRTDVARPMALEEKPVGHPAHGSEHDPAQRAPSATEEDDHSTAGTPATPPIGTSHTCPMHSEVVRSGPGNCPKCGMRLVEKKAQP